MKIHGDDQDGNEKAIQYFEVVTKKGKSQLHLGIPKDSLVLILGEPDDISSHSIGSDIIEELGYKVKMDDISDLTFTFENGKLERYNQF